ncbi:hypothetical protein EB796_004652 [Bugula neritina]|uniref:Uncharacterized protein n=1 Tax=Bugula neritina TaxID=10212 RepID=A0A7J7KFM8_BUGNE|nr:hypothetical protein EB796_004652 [Bugula neritina]
MTVSDMITHHPSYPGYNTQSNGLFHGYHAAPHTTSNHLFNSSHNSRPAFGIHDLLGLGHNQQLSPVPEYQHVSLGNGVGGGATHTSIARSRLSITLVKSAFKGNK